MVDVAKAHMFGLPVGTFRWSAGQGLWHRDVGMFTDRGERKGTFPDQAF